MSITSRSAAAVVGLVALLPVTACMPAPPPRPTATPAPRPSQSLTGTWESRTSTTTIRFTFAANSTYESLEATEYQIPLGWFRFRREQLGTVSVSGGTLELTPQQSTRNRSMPEDRKGDYADRPEPLAPRRFDYRLDAGTLHLRETDKPELTLARQP